MLYNGFVNAGFSEDEAMTMLLEFIRKLAPGFGIN